MCVCVCAHARIHTPINVQEWRLDDTLRPKSKWRGHELTILCPHGRRLEEPIIYFPRCLRVTGSRIVYKSGINTLLTTYSLGDEKKRDTSTSLSRDDQFDSFTVPGYPRNEPRVSSLGNYGHTQNRHSGHPIDDPLPSVLGPSRPSAKWSSWQVS